MVYRHRKQGAKMELEEIIIPGMTREETFIVEEQHTAYHIGSGDEKVLGTPWMISFMERVSNRLIAEHLPANLMSVGVHVDVKHLAATPMKASVQVRAKVLEVVKNRVKLSIEAWDSRDKIGEGTHLRAVVEKDRFMQRVMSKTA
jgi:fluoroacetyl-CoA thioesterase